MTDNTISFDAVLDDGISGPLTGITRRFKGLVTAGQRLSRTLSPLSNQFTQIATAVVGIEGVRRALNAAGAQAKAEQQILAALKGNTEELTKIVNLTKEIQSRAVFNDADLLASANTLLQMGVNTDNLEKGLQASVETASALGLTLESTTKSFGLIESAGLAGELGERIPFLRELISEGRSFAEITDVVLDRFGGIAEAAVSGPFGKLQIEIDSTTDILETFGNEFITVVNPAVEVFNDLLSRGAKIVSGPEFTTFLSLIAQVQPLVTPILAIFAGITGAAVSIKILSIGLGLVLGNVLSVAAAVTGILTSIGAIPLLVTLLISRFDVTKTIIDSILGSIKSAISAIAGDGLTNIGNAVKLLSEGKANIEDVVKIIGLELSKFGSRLNISVLIPIKVALTSIKDFALGLVDLVVSTVKVGVLGVLDTVVGGLSRVFNFLGVDLDFKNLISSIDNEINDVEQKGIAAFKRVSEAFNFSENVKEQRKIVEEELEKTEKASDELGRNLEQRRIRKLEANLRKFQLEAASDIDKLSKEFQAKLQDSFTLGEGPFIDEESLFGDLSVEGINNALSLLSGNIQSNVVSAFSKAIDEAERLDKASATEVANLRIALLGKVNNSRIDFLESGEDTEGSVASLRERITAIDDEKASIEEQIKTYERVLQLYKNSNVVLSAQSDIIEKIRVRTERLRNKESEQLRVLDSIGRAENELNSLRSQRAIRVREQIEIVTAIAENEAEKIEEAYDNLNTQRESIADRFSTGVLTRSGVIDAEQAAVDEFNRIATSVDNQLTGLIARFPEATANIEGLRKKLQETRDIAGSDTDNGSLFDGAIRGARAATAEFQDLGLQGERIGSTLILSFGNGLTEALFESGKSLKQFTADFLIQIAKMIAQLIIFRALSSAFNFSGGATGATDGVGATGPVPLPGSVPGFNQGGRVPGPNVNRDVVAAMLTPGEQVVDRDTAAFYGAAFFERMKKRLIPKGPISGAASVAPTQYLNSGGRAVSQKGGSSSGSPSLAVIVPDAQSLERQLAAGTPALLEWMQENGFKKDGFDR